jgi:hypothetical protein
VVAIGASFAFRGDAELLPAPTPEPTAESTATRTIPPTATASPMATPQPSATPLPSPTLAAGRRSRPAPIESVKVEVQESLPRQYIVVIVAGLPNGCAERYAQDVKREGDVFIITILNSEPIANVPCTLIFRTYEVRVTIADSLQSGRTYTVRVNDQQTTFTAR